MTTIKFHTNIDDYQTNCFPTNLQDIPRIGEYVQVVAVYMQHFQNKKLPCRLQVVSVTHTENYVLCELHYSEIDNKIRLQNLKNK